LLVIVPALLGMLLLIHNVVYPSWKKQEQKNKELWS